MARTTVPGPQRRMVTPERLYVASLGLTGFAALVSVSLPAAERGELAATIVSATMGAALGGFSIDTFLLSRPAGWVASRGRSWVLALAGAALCLSAAVAVLLTAVGGLGSYPVSIAAAAALTAFNAAGSLALRLERFRFVYTVRAAGGLILVAGYAILLARGRLDGVSWSVMWLAVQLLGAAVVGGAVVAWARSRRMPGGTAADPERRADVAALGKLHVGVCAQMLTYRLDQILIARFAGAGPLGVYALAAAALEFAQAGAVVRAQRILAGRKPDAAPERVGTLLRAALPVALAAIAGLALLGALRDGYDRAWIMGLCLLPGTLAVTAGKTWSALLLKRRGERATTAVALITMAVAVALYFLLIPWAGAMGAAVASSAAYTVYALRSRQGLRAGAPALVGRAV